MGLKGNVKPDLEMPDFNYLFLCLERLAFCVDQIPGRDKDVHFAVDLK